MTPETPTCLESSAPGGGESKGSADAYSTFGFWLDGKPPCAIANRDLQIPFGLP